MVWFNGWVIGVRSRAPGPADVLQGESHGDAGRGTLPAMIPAARRVGPFTLQSWQARTDGPLLAAAAVFLVVLTVPVVDLRLDPGVKVALQVLDVLIWAAFVLDYTVRLYLAPQRWLFVRTHVPDALMVALPALRPLRILRLLSLGSLLARRSANTQLVDTGRLVAGTAALVVYLGAVGTLDAERGAAKANITSFGDALWWASTTITTVGYGDRYPVTPLGRIIAVSIMLVGIALLGVLTASIAAWFVRQSTEAATEIAVQAITAVVDEATEIEQRAEHYLADELAEILQAVANLDTRLRSLAGQSRS